MSGANGVLKVNHDGILIPLLPGGESNTASNVGSAGVGVFDGKTGINLGFRNLVAASTKITVALDAGNKNVDLDVDESALSLANLGTRAITDLSDVGSKTGTGTEIVFSQFPTLNAPAIASFVSAGHDHADGAGGGTLDHGALTGRTDDDHSIYALLAGRSGGQTQIGGTASGNDLTLQSTSNATRGHVFLGGAKTSGYDEVNDSLGLGTITPAAVSTSDRIVAVASSFTPTIAAYAYTTSTGRAGAFSMGRARGTEASPSAVQTGDRLGTFFFRGYSGTSWLLPARILCEVDGTVTTSLVPMNMEFRTGSSGAGVRALVIDSSGDIDFPITNQKLTFASTSTTFIFGNSSLISIGGNVRIDFEIGDTVVAKIDEDGGNTPKFTVDGYLVIEDGVTAPGVITDHASIYVDTSDGDLKVRFADGNIVVLAAN